MHHRSGLLGKSLLLFLLAGIGIACFKLFCFSTTDGDSDVDHQLRFNENYRIFSLNLPKEMTFCGERVPLDLLDVRERLDRELLVNTYWQSSSLLAHKRANRWFPLIDSILERNGVPDDMKYIPLVESGLTNVVSPAGAAGFWQFMKETAAQEGLEVNSEVDERYNVARSTEAACQHLKAARERYGSWTMAAAAYNLGRGNLDDQIGRQQERNYYNLLLPEETSRYVFRILAMKAIITDPERYGFHLRQKDLYPPYPTRTAQLTAPVADLNAFAAGNGTNYKLLKLLNPWLRDNKLTGPAGKTYTILLPADGFNSATAENE